MHCPTITDETKQRGNYPLTALFVVLNLQTVMRTWYSIRSMAEGMPGWAEGLYPKALPVAAQTI